MAVKNVAVVAEFLLKNRLLFKRDPNLTGHPGQAGSRVLPNTATFSPSSRILVLWDGEKTAYITSALGFLTGIPEEGLLRKLIVQNIVPAHA